MSAHLYFKEVNTPCPHVPTHLLHPIQASASTILTWRWTSKSTFPRTCLGHAGIQSQQATQFLGLMAINRVAIRFLSFGNSIVFFAAKFSKYEGAVNSQIKELFGLIKVSSENIRRHTRRFGKQTRKIGIVGKPEPKGNLLNTVGGVKQLSFCQ